MLAWAHVVYLKDAFNPFLIQLQPLGCSLQDVCANRQRRGKSSRYPKELIPRHCVIRVARGRKQSTKGSTENRKLGGWAADRAQEST